MHFQQLLLVAIITVLGVAQDIDSSDVPQACRDICAPVVSLTQRCDNQTDTDAAEAQCVCNGTDSSTIVPLCADCIAQNGGDRDNDAYDLVSSCSFNSTSYDATAASSALGSASSSAPASASASATGSTTAVAASNTAMQSGTGSEQLTNAAPAPTVAAAAGLGALGLVLML